MFWSYIQGTRLFATLQRKWKKKTEIIRHNVTWIFKRIPKKVMKYWKNMTGWYSYNEILTEYDHIDSSFQLCDLEIFVKLEEIVCNA